MASHYKEFKVERKLYGPDDKEVYQIFGKSKGWFKPWKFLTEVYSEEAAEKSVKRYAKYPQVTGRTYYDENGREDTAWGYVG